jgi:hypothetical protein
VQLGQIHKGTLFFARSRKEKRSENEPKTKEKRKKNEGRFFEEALARFSTPYMASAFLLCPIL